MLGCDNLPANAGAAPSTSCIHPPRQPRQPRPAARGKAEAGREEELSKVMQNPLLLFVSGAGVANGTQGGQFRESRVWNTNRTPFILSGALERVFLSSSRPLSEDTVAKNAGLVIASAARSARSRAARMGKPEGQGGQGG